MAQEPQGWIRPIHSTFNFIPQFRSWRGDRIAFLCVNCPRLSLGTGWNLCSPLSLETFPCEWFTVQTLEQAGSSCPGWSPNPSELKCPVSWGRARGSTQLLVQHCPLQALVCHYIRAIIYRLSQKWVFRILCQALQKLLCQGTCLCQ